MVSLYPHQMDNLARSIRQPRFLNCDDPGTGKTPPSCLKIWYAWHDLGLRTWWQMPTTLQQKNLDELYRWSEFAPGDCIIYTGNEDLTNVKVVISSFARFRKCWNDGWPLGQVVIDEPQLGYKTFGSATVNALLEAMLGRENRHLLIMSGSLIAGRLDAAYPMLACCAPWLYSSYPNFIAEHSYEDLFTGKRHWINHDLLRRRIAKFATFRSYSELHPGEQYVIEPVEWVDMSKRHLAKYRELEKEAMLELDDRWLEAEQPGVHALRADQILAHPNELILDTGTYNLIGHEEPGKDEHLRIHFMDHLRQGTRVAVFCRFVPEVRRVARLAESCGLRVGAICESVPVAKRPELDRMFREHQLDVMVATAATAGVGLNWPFLDHIIFATVDYADDHYKQAIFRALRGDRSKPVRVTTLAYRKAAVELRKLRIIQEKSEDAWKVEQKGKPIRFDFGCR